MSQHTPGPWQTDGERVYSLTERGTIDRTVSDCTPAPEDEDGGDSLQLPEARANARLIAAAPDLLAALRELVTLWDSPEPFTGADALQAIGEATERARAAIAKAREGATD